MLTNCATDSRIDRYSRLAGIGKRVTPHTFRHTCATLMLRNRADIRHIQAMMGHESLESTQSYTRVAGGNHLPTKEAGNVL